MTDVFDNEEFDSEEEEMNKRERDLLVYVVVDDGEVIDWHKTFEEAVEATEDAVTEDAVTEDAVTKDAVTKDAADRELFICKVVAVITRKIITEIAHV